MKEKILGIAIRQMKSGGYAHLNFAHIAEELNTTRANLHHHYKNKEGLAVAATERYIQDETATMDEIIRSNDGDIFSILAEIENYIMDFVSRSESCNACICSQLIYESQAPDSLRQLARDRVNAELEDFADQIEKAIKSGTLPESTDVEVLAFRIVATYSGIGQMALVETDKQKLARNVKGALVSILR